MRKGFTLVELLSVIVILGIVSLIAFPTLTGIINKSRLNKLKNSAYGLIEASDLYYAQYGSNNIRFDITGSSVTSKDTDKLLSFKGNVKNGVSIIKKNGKTVICVTDGKNSAYKNYNEDEVHLISKKVCTVPDNKSIVYLDGTATLSELSNQELTDLVSTMQDEINSLKTQVSSLSNKSTSFDEIYPVGSYYFTDSNTNPAALFGGTWEKVEGRFLLGSSSNYEVGTTGGNTSVSYTPQGAVGNHTLTVSEIPSHTHTQYLWAFNGAGASGGNFYGIDYKGNTGGLIASSGSGEIRWYNGNTGGNQPHNHPFTGTQSNINIMPPYMVVNIWKRTA